MSYINLRSGILHLDADITWDSATALLVTIRELDNDPDVQAIKLHITSLGGSTQAAIAIAQALQSCQKPVHTIGTGYIASSAVLVLAGGHASYRSVMEGSILMLHSPRLPRPDAAYLTLQQMTEFLRNMEMKASQYYEELARVTGQTVPFWRDQLRDDRPDRFLTPAEAVKLGLADQAVIRPRQPR